MQDEHGFTACAYDVHMGGTVVGWINDDPQTV